jgi:hypothetical protein
MLTIYPLMLGTWEIVAIVLVVLLLLVVLIVVQCLAVVR